MITRTPYDRDNLKIGKKDKVLEVGPGHSPTFRSNVLVDLFVDSNYHRCGNLKIYPHQQFINANGEALPLKIKNLIMLFVTRYLSTRKILPSLSANNAELPKGGIWKRPVCWENFFSPRNHINGLFSTWTTN